MLAATREGEAFTAGPWAPPTAIRCNEGSPLPLIVFCNACSVVVGVMFRVDDGNGDDAYDEGGNTPAGFGVVTVGFGPIGDGLAMMTGLESRAKSRILGAVVSDCLRNPADTITAPDEDVDEMVQFFALT